MTLSEVDVLAIATHYGLGLHSWRINAEDANFPSNLSHIFKVCAYPAPNSSLWNSYSEF